MPSPWVIASAVGATFTAALLLIQWYNNSTTTAIEYTPTRGSLCEMCRNELGYGKSTYCRSCSRSFHSTCVREYLRYSSDCPKCYKPF